MPTTNMPTTNMPTTKKKTKKVVLKTAEGKASVQNYLNSIEPAAARRDAKTLAKIFKLTTKAKPKMWGSSIVGYGKYTYFRANGDEAKIMAAGFSMRKGGPVIYNMPDSKKCEELLSSLGKHKLGKSCLYINKLDHVDLDVLAKLLILGVEELKQKYEVNVPA